MNNIFTSPLFYIFITIGLYSAFEIIYKKIKKIYLHPLILTSSSLILYIIILSFITEYNIEKNLIEYNNSMNIVNIMLGPLTVCLALPIYKNFIIFKKNWLAILIGTIIGCLSSILSIYILGNVFDLDDIIIKSLLPKSVTTAIAKEISININAIPEITIAAVIITGIFGAMVGPKISKLLRFNDHITNGMSFGSASHAIGTSKAMEISLEAGAVSSIAIVTSGILTMIITLFI